MLVPAILLIPMLFLIFVVPGISPGIDLTGGNVIIVRSQQELTEGGVLSAIEGFDLPELRISTITSPTGYGAWIQYSKNPLINEAEEVIAQAEANLENEVESISLSKQVISLLGGEDAEYDNAKLALLDA